MKRIPRDTWIAGGLLVVLVVITVATSVYSARSEEWIPRLSTFSSAPGGARALFLWLEAAGLPATRQTLESFYPPEDTALVLILAPSLAIEEGEWEVLDTWVEEGGTLVIAGDDWIANSALRHYHFQLSHRQVDDVTTQTPLLSSPPLSRTVPVQARAVLQTARHDFVTHLAAGNRPVLVSFEQGKGRVFLSSTPFPFSNAGLKEDGNPALVWNVVTAGSRPGDIWFDEWHHGFHERSSGFSGWLRRTPMGHAILYATAVVFLALALRGRLFGRPVPLSRHVLRRAPLEYITAIANLNRRAGHRQSVLRHYHRRLKRVLGKRYRLSPALPDAEYVARLAEYVPDLDTGRLAQLLAQLRQKTVSERELVHLASEVAEWLKELT